nr:hypothetical protein GCM10020092_080900 [Actinoplanes digitatis]
MAYCENLFAADFGGRRPDGSTAFAKDGEAISSHFFGQSSFASHANVVQESVIKVDPQVPLEVVAPLGCGIQTGAGDGAQRAQTESQQQSRRHRNRCRRLRGDHGRESGLAAPR